MKSKLISSIACLAFAGLLTANAQEMASNDGSPAHDPAAQQQEQTFRKIEGCLAYNGVSFVLAVVSNGPKQYRVVGGDVAALKGKEGHTVEIDGLTGRNNPAEMVQNWDQRQATTGVGWYTISAEHVTDVTSNCSYPGFEQPLSHVHTN